MDTYRDLTEWAADRLARAGVENPRLEAQILIAWAGAVSRVDVLANPDRRLGEEARERFTRAIHQRETRFPLAYIRGTQEFYGLEFTVTRAVLIPRPETELLVDFAIETAACEQDPVIWDVGTGSGCIAVASALSIPRASIIASDLSDAALRIAAINVEKHGIRTRTALVCVDLLTAARPESVSIILANPPYIGSGELSTLQPEVRDHEPVLALQAREGGLFPYRRLVPQAFKTLKPGGWLATEVGMGQAGRVAELLQSGGLHNIAVRKDLAGIERMVMGQKP